MRLYHGTDKRFRIPNLEKCFPYTDFGKGFYLTHEFERAKEWAADHNNKKYRVNVYEVTDDFIDKARQNGLSVKVFESADPEWAEFVYNNRHLSDFSHGFDIVIGPVADNGLQAKFAKMNKDGLTFAEISREICYERFRKPQICFCTQNSLKLLKYLKANVYTN